MEHVPGATRMARVPETVQTPGEFDEKVTVSPELAVADRVTGESLRK
jgi:hypothetical protein